MNYSKKGIAVSILVIGFGVAWLLNALEIFQAVDWVWAICLGLSGILILTLGGINKLTVVAGPFLLAAAVCSVLRQTGQMPLKLELPILTIFLGVQLLLIQVLPVPDVPKMTDDSSDDKPSPDAK